MVAHSIRTRIQRCSPESCVGNVEIFFRVFQLLAGYVWFSIPFHHAIIHKKVPDSFDQIILDRETWPTSENAKSLVFNDTLPQKKCCYHKIYPYSSKRRKYN